MGNQVEVDSKDFAAFYTAIAKTDLELKKSLRKKMTGLAKPIVRDVRAAAKAIPAKGEVGETRSKKDGAGLGLRASLALATASAFRVKGHTSVLKVRVSGTKFASVFKNDNGGNSRMLPYRMDGAWAEQRPWKHPVFGRKDTEVTQKPHPFLWDAVSKHKEEVNKEIAKAVDETLAFIDKKVTQRGI